MNKTQQNIPKKFLSRKDEITADFLRLAEAYIADLLQGRVKHRLHTRDFAEKLFIHPRHLTNTLKLTIDKSPCDVLEEKLLAEAEKLLLETNLSIAEIGYKFAFEDPTNFSKFFKGMTGISPLQYRKRSEAVP